MVSQPRITPNDLEEILSHTQASVWDALRGARILITGGTGFFGKWLCESWVHANRELGLGAHATVLTRNPEKFLSEFPHLKNTNALSFVAGDLLDPSKWPSEWASIRAPVFTHILHAATPVDLALEKDDPARLKSIIVDGTRSLLELARLITPRPRFLLVSSGAVYGRQPQDITRFEETYVPNPADLTPSAYAEGKREAEKLALDAPDLPVVIARCFAFAGPHLPLDQHYAFGNFIRDARAGGPVRVSGDGSPIRTYLYAADLAAWLWTLLAQGRAGQPYNVGSDQEISVADLARKIAGAHNVTAEITGASTATLPVSPAATGLASNRYVPSIDRAREELGLDVWTSLDEMIKRTSEWASG